MRRIFCGILLALGLATFGFVIGAELAGRFLVSKGEALAGGATVAVGGLARAGVGLITGIALAYLLASAHVLRAALLALVLAAASIGLVAWRAMLR